MTAVETEMLLANRMKRYSYYFAFGFFILAFVILAGWVFNIRDYITIIPGMAPMNPTTSVLFCLFYFSFLLLREKSTKLQKATGKVLTLFIMAISVARYADWRFGTHLEWDNVLYPDKIFKVIPDAVYSRMSPVIALCFIVGGASLFGLHYENSRKHMPLQYGALLIATTGFTGLLTFIYSFNAFSGSLKYVIMAFPTALGAVMMGLSLLFVHSDKGLMRKFTSNLAGGVMARQVIPFVIVLPVVFGAVRLYLKWWQINTNEAWLTVGVLAVILSFLIFTSYVTRLLNRRDEKVIMADDALRKLNADLEEKVKVRTEDVRRSEAKYRKLLENNFEAIALSDSRFIPFYRSPSADRITGFTVEERVAQAGAYDMTHPDDREMLKKVMDDVVQMPGELFKVRFRTMHKNGRYLWMEGFITNMLHDNDVRGIVTNFRDVTQQVESQEMLLQSVRNISDYKQALDASSIVWITDREGKMIYVNDNFCRISKHNQGELVGAKDRIVNTKHHSKDFAEQLQSTIAGGNIWRGELKNDAKDGSVYWTDTTIVPFVDKEGRPYQYVAISADITERKRAEEQINELTRELRNLLEHVQKSREDERKHIAREIHDDLGQRLTALRMQSSILIKKLQEGAANNEYLLTELHDQHKEIINSLKSVKQIATDLRPEILDHLGILEAVKWQAQQFESSTGVKCEVIYHEEDLDLRPALANTVYRIVQESLTNVARHSRASHVEIFIENAHEQLKLQIKDDGRGIKNHELQDKKSFGLIGMRERIHILRGELTITGEPNKGTTVAAEIPLKK